MERTPANPKPSRTTRQSRAHWYPYYAGYSPAFVSDVLFGLAPDPAACVLDPWNGSGTTTSVCSTFGVRSVGFDINPAMVVVAKARLLAGNTAPSFVPLLESAFEIARSLTAVVDASDPLHAWFDKGTVARLRSLERAVSKLFVHDSLAIRSSVNDLSSLAAFYYVLLFRLVRRSLCRAVSSNPTWVKAKAEVGEKARLDWKTIRDQLLEDVAEIRLLDGAFDRISKYASSEVRVGDSCQIPVEDNSIDAVITSPPYCTRIDYAVSTRAELAVLGIGAGDFDSLRRRMIGTTLSSKCDRATLSDASARLLDRIASHPSKASATYYFSTFYDYFLKLEASLREVSRVIKRKGTLTLVVQDSAYKDIHIDLAAQIQSLIATENFEGIGRWDFPVGKSMRQIHTVSRAHKSSWQPTETVLQFRKH